MTRRQFLTIITGMMMLNTSQSATHVLPKRILFIGNSYTSQIKGTLLDLVEQSPYADTAIEFITSGGRMLSQHLTHQATLATIRDGDWDLVVLQEQSQVPALAGQYEQSFQESVDQFSQLIRQAGAEPALYMTWGKRDGDDINPTILPDYDTMQQALNTAYLKAAQRTQSRLLPVGLVWAAIREQHDDVLGVKLYQADGSHPSAKGAYLVAGVLMCGLFRISPGSVPSHQGVTEGEVELIKQVMRGVYGQKTDG